MIHCDYHGKCRAPAFAEVYWEDKSGETGWSNLWFAHFVIENYIKHKKLLWGLAEGFPRIIRHDIWNWIMRALPLVDSNGLHRGTRVSLWSI